MAGHGTGFKKLEFQLESHYGAYMMNTKPFGRRACDMVNMARMRNQLTHHGCITSQSIFSHDRQASVQCTDIPQEDVPGLIANDITQIIRELNDIIPAFRQINEVRRRVLIDMVFSMGIVRFMDLREMLNAVRGQDYVRAAEIISDLSWDVQEGRVRRLASMMATGDEVVLS